MTREEQHRVSARRTCAACLRQAAYLASKRPGSPAFLIGIHARLLSRELWRAEIAPANKDAISQMIALVPESAVDVRVALAKALWTARIALGERPTLPRATPTPRRRRTGEVRDFNDLYSESRRAERLLDAAAVQKDALTAQQWHERLLALTQTGRELPVQSTVDAALLLDDLRRRARYHRGTRAREFRVYCREASLSLFAPPYRVGVFDVERLASIASVLDSTSHADLEADFLKVAEFLNDKDGLLAASVGHRKPTVK